MSMISAAAQGERDLFGKAAGGGGVGGSPFKSIPALKAFVPAPVMIPTRLVG